MENNNRNDNILEKSDIETIIKVNNKAIELQTEISDQFEDVISLVKKTNDEINRVSDDVKDIKKEITDLNKLQFRILLLLSSGVISLLVQIIILLKK